MAWYPCCCDDCEWCTGSVPATKTVTFSGISDADCTNCSALNTSFVCDFVECEQLSSTTHVTWQYTGVITCSGTDYDVIVTLTWGSNFTTTGSAWDVTLEVYNSTPTRVWLVQREVGGQAGYVATDCTATFSAGAASETGSFCAPTGLNVQCAITA